ncbi:MAG: alpha/beta hydrolase [Kofleriaceae bacterium]
MRALLLALACSSACSSAPSSEPSPAVKEGTPVATATKGELVTASFESKALGVTKDVVVYLPAGYASQPTKRWPVFYYLHGLTGNETNWSDGFGLDEAADAMKLGAIVVMPDGDDGFYTDSATPRDYDACLRDGTGLFVPSAPKKTTCVRAAAYEQYIVKDLIAWVDATYRTIATKQGRAIAGLSMGGYGALKLAMKYPDLFVATASHSGVDSLLYLGPDPYVAGKAVLVDNLTKAPKDPFSQWMIGIFGVDIENWRANDPTSLVGKLAPGTLQIYLDCGTEDEFRLHNGAQYLHDLLLAKKIDHVWYLGPGQHDGEFWRERVPHSLAFLAKHVVAK